MIPIKTRDEIGRMRASGRIAAEVLDAVAGRIAPGVPTAELDEFAAAMIRERGARSAFKGYRGYPGHICVSVNREVVHGIPGPRRIEPGDIVSLDVGVVFDGFVGDTARTVMVGVTDERVARLVLATEQALWAGIARAVDGGRLSDISHAIESTASAAGFSVVRDFVGHGVGRAMHEEPQIPNFGAPGRGPRLREGMTLAIEPMVNLGGSAVRTLDDGWTAVTQDGDRKSVV